METESVTESFDTVPVIQRDLSTSHSPLSPPTMLRTSSSRPLENTDKPASDPHNGRVQSHLSMDLVEEVKGMYRLLDLISESGSSNCVNKIIIAADSLKRFINAMRPGAFTAITKIDFKTLDGFTIKPIGIYGSKVEIVRLLRSLNAVNEDVARLLLLPIEHGGIRPALSSGLYVIASGRTNVPQDRHYVIYWPEDSTWDDSAASSVCQNRVMFMRYLTKVCDQVVALLSTEHSASIVWDEDYDDTESIDMDFGDEDRLFAYRVRKRRQETAVASCPGFQMNSAYISRGAPPADCSVDPSIFIPTLLHGEVAQGFWKASYVPPKTRTTTLYQHPCSKLYLKQLLEANSLVLSEYLKDEAVRILIDEVISNTFPKQCEEWYSATMDTRKSFREEMRKRQGKACQDFSSQEASLRRALLDAVVDDVMKLFPSIERHELVSNVDSLDPDMNHEIPQRTRVSDLRQSYRGFDSLYRRHVEDAKFGVVKGPEFTFLKERLTFVRHLLKERRDLSSKKRTELIQTLLSGDDIRKQVIPKPDKNKAARRPSLVSRFTAVSSSPKGADEESLGKEMKKMANGISDADFLLELKGVDDEDLKAPTQEAVDLAHTQLSLSIDAAVKKMTPAVLQMQQDECKKGIQQQVETEQRNALHGVLVNFIQDVNKNSAGRRPSVVHIDDIQQGGSGDGSSSPDYKVTGRIDVPEEPKLEFRVYLVDLAGDDKRNMQLNPKHVPNPVVSDRRSGVFHLPLGLRIVFHRLLENERLLLVLADQDKHTIYLERLAEMNAAMQRDRPIKTFNRNKIGENVLFAYDEAKRTLAVCASAKMKLHMFVFDKTFKTIQSRGSSVNLALWYSPAAISIVQLCFVCGRDEVVLVDSNAQVKVSSFVTQQIRSLQLPLLPSAVYSSPDGSCLLALQAQGSQRSLAAYRWEKFGSTNGLSLQLPAFTLDGAVVTSMVSRGHIFLLALDVDAQCLHSMAIDITSTVTGFTFREKGSKYASKYGAGHTQHNSLLDCHKEVWTHFPILPSVKRRTITSLSERRPRSLTFITENPTQPFASYFSDLIQGFVKETRKPTGDELYRIKVSATNFKSFRDKAALDPIRDVSRCRLGEWLVDLLRLIPIHIAVCRGGRFVPLVDGVISAEREGSLRGADVNQIVDKLSFGWYESIFQSYMASKPVKVVSSVGPRAVGKRFLLDHLVDTSFGGSAMWTTDGVWMSVVPTDEELIVALDFEGLDSDERSLQEATFLVLFNTAISNLVLFRNNFALGQDIGGLFQPFQSSASIMDPAANPSLFQSTLIIIIKDAFESEKAEITREFSLKLQEIVEEEQGADFISRLHRGKLDIIPWPVVETKEFYRLFTILKGRFDLQKISHQTAGEFLHTIKTLMAKIMTNDWGALSHTMAKHRAKTLSTLLWIALSTGFAETEPQLVPLKDLDADLILENYDTTARFAISDGVPVSQHNIEEHLTALLGSWSPIMPRQSIPDSEWVAELVSHIDAVVGLRVNHVRSWLGRNLRRFEEGHAAVGDLRRRFDDMVVELRMNVQLCCAQCASCNLLCIRSRFHEGGHCCNTNHTCMHICGFCEDDQKPCGTRAGHAWNHICAVPVHRCGEPCKLFGRRGCLEHCTKDRGHAEDGHMCPAPVHMCGEPCALQGMMLPDGKTYSCQERCSIPIDQAHDTHSCNTSLRTCPLLCELCKRPCDGPHLHGLTPGTHHLCGETHMCSALCSGPGICQIETSPQSNQATFTGRHETFQYTKYTQVAKQLQCVKAIPQGRTSHEGSHIHSEDNRHTCKVRCESCGYFCTLPLGHSPQVHETSHGSMTQTRWAVDGPDGTVLELGGRKFSSNDEGGPMMCSFVCRSMGRHVHIDYCPTEKGGRCPDAEVQHINERITPDPNRPKDAITHRLHWRRMGFEDPYTHTEQKNFAKCDAMCPGPEHSGTTAGTGQPSYCNLPMFHPPRDPNGPVNGLGYISIDGHQFECDNPAVRQNFHVIFVIDRSGSMSSTDLYPRPGERMTDLIQQTANDRLGAVYSALYGFWSSRHDAVAVDSQAIGARRDAYSVILFNEATTNVLTNDFTSTPDQLLGTVLSHQADGGTNFTVALRAGRKVMEQNWSTERAPVMIFLSDGQCQVSDTATQDLCSTAVRLGIPLSFHTVSFGPEASSSTLRRMADLALDIQNNAPRDPLRPPTVSMPSSFLDALHSVRLVETFVGIAESLRKPRGSLMP